MTPATASRVRIALRLVPALLLLAVATFFTLRVVHGLAARRNLRVELSEVCHVRYGLLDPTQWVARILPILDARIDALDLTSANQASLKPTVEAALYRLLDDVKAKMSAPPANPQPSGGLGGLLGQGGALMANMMIGTLRPHVPEYAGVVLAELGRPQTKTALKNYMKSVLSDAAKTTFGNIDRRWYAYILKKHGCADGLACRQVLGDEIQTFDRQLNTESLIVLGAALLGFLLLLTTGAILPRWAAAILLLFCVVLLLGGILTPMLEVEAKITQFHMTFLGAPISFDEQVLYYQSKSVLEVFQTLMEQGRPDMWIVGVLVLTFSVVFPTLKISTSVLCLLRPSILPRYRVARFFVLESSKWSMADVMALAIFMSYVAFNGLIAHTMSGLKETGAQLVLPTDSSKLLPGYYLFIGFCLASLFLARKLGHSLRAAG